MADKEIEAAVSSAESKGWTGAKWAIGDAYFVLTRTETGAK